METNNIPECIRIHLFFYPHTRLVTTLRYKKAHILLFVCSLSIVASGSSLLQCFNLFPTGPESKSASVALPAPTHTNWLEYDIIFQAELIVSGARFSLHKCVRTLLCYTMQPWLPGMALMKTYEKLDASWLSGGWGCVGGGGCRKREDGRTAEKAESDLWEEDGEMGKDRDEMQEDRKMDERKDGRETYWRGDPSPLDDPASQMPVTAVHCSSDIV